MLIIASSVRFLYRISVPFHFKFIHGINAAGNDSICTLLSLSIIIGPFEAVVREVVEGRPNLIHAIRIILLLNH